MIGQENYSYLAPELFSYIHHGNPQIQNIDT